MSIIVTCSQCGRRLEAKEEWGGRRVKCPECGQAVTIPPGAGQPPQARPIGAAPQRARPVQRTQSAQLSPESGGGILDLLNDASMGPPAGALSGRPLGQPPAARRRKSGSNRTLFIALVSFAGVGLLVICCGIGTVFLGPAVEAGREAAIRVKARETLAKGAPIPVVLAAPEGATLAQPAAPSGPIWTPDARFAAQLRRTSPSIAIRFSFPPDLPPRNLPRRTICSGRHCELGFGQVSLIQRDAVASALRRFTNLVFLPSDLSAISPRKVHS